MYCPNCNKEYEGRFCPECGTKLIEKPSAAAFNLNLGDANAVSGGLNMSDSHNVHNEDKSVHNISNVTHNITQVAAQKTELELFQEKKALFLTECKRAYEDNVLEQHEVVALEEYRLKLGLDKATADSILESVRIMTESNARKTSLNPIAKTKLRILTENLKRNEVKALMDQIDGLEALVNRFEHDELSRKYYLVLAALKPEKCIDLKEKSKTDSYWKSFWSYLAYISVRRTAEAENVLMSLDRFADYPEDNITVLAVAGALMNEKKAEAKEYLDSVTGEYTTALQRFVDSLYLLLEPEMAKEIGADENTCAFYLVNFFNHNNCKNNGVEQECTIPYTIDDESGTFTGIVADGLPVKGILIYDSGDSYEGEFRDGNLHGLGKYTWADGVVYEGEWEEGNFNGRGKYTWPSGQVYEGEFKDDKFHGYGKLTFDDGAVFEGEWKDGERNGHGKVTDADGSYEGEWKDDFINGYGKMTYANGEVYEGEWKEGNRHGYGKFTNADGTVFEGEWKDDERIDHGTAETKGLRQECTMPYTIDDDSGTFTGIAVDGKPIKGLFEFEGGTFEGEFIEGKPFKGVLKFSEGGTFEGEFKDGNPYNGALTDATVEDATITVKVVAGEFNGYGRMSLTEGGSFEGEFKDGGPFNGIYNDFACEGDVMTGRLVNGKLEGYGSMRFEDGSRFEGEFKDGEPWNGKLFDMVIDDGKRIDTQISEGEPQMDTDLFLHFLDALSEEDDEEQECTMAYSWNDCAGTFHGKAIDEKPVKGILEFDEGGTFEGEFNDGEPFNGVLTDVPFEENSTVTTDLVDGKPGDVVIKYKDGHRFEGELNNGDPYNGMMFNYIMKDGSVVDSKVTNGKIQAVEEAIRKAKEEARIKAEQEALRKKITYSLFVTSVTDQIQAMMTARVTFGWSVAEYRKKLAKLPAMVSTSESFNEIQKLQSTLLNGGYEANISAKNALGVYVDVPEKSKETPKKKNRKK